MVDFATFLGAVRKQERKDKYLILSALFHLNAHSLPKTAREVSDLLRLRCGNAAPRNVSDYLRKNPAFVQPIAKGPPLQWALTKQGIEHLQSLSGLDLAYATNGDNFDTEIGIVCALEHPELSAIIQTFGGSAAWREVESPSYTHVYRSAKLNIKNGKHLRIVATTSTSMGLTAAAIATTHLVLKFRPKIVVMVGIAAGTRSGNKRFGDVLVADPSVDYSSGKVSSAGGIREFLPDPYPIGLNPRLRSVLHKYGGDHPIFTDIRQRWTGSLPPGGNRLHLGPLGAADQVIDDETRIFEIQKNWRKLIGVEMETYGVYRACYEAPEPKPRFVSFKSVCDFAAGKTDSWQDYAAFVAAEFALEFFSAEWDNLWPKS